MTKKLGVVMPISKTESCSADHWAEVYEIVSDVAKELEYDCRLVSDTYETNLIHQEIVENIYNDEVVVCDISERNPNVFFELGLRMATQKPTVIIKDYDTDCPFDVSNNRYLEYPRDLHYQSILRFKADLSKLIQSTAKQKATDSFIGRFTFKSPEISKEVVPQDEYVLDRLDRIENLLRQPRPRFASENKARFAGGLPVVGQIYQRGEVTDICIRHLKHDCVDAIRTELANECDISEKEIKIDQRQSNHHHLLVDSSCKLSVRELEQLVKELAGKHSAHHT